MYRNAVRYVHPKFGEIWLAPNSEARRLQLEGKHKEVEKCVGEACERAAKLEGNHARQA